MNPTTVGELKAKLSEYADDELVLVDGMDSDRDIASVEYDVFAESLSVEGMKNGYLVICGTSEGMN
jgi:hypothetical protein